ncbi:peptidoglycan editing factor PgeF [Marinobacter sp. VGCF2001]|uniref:peptidoglycan editing factor PgeF n=1 Tax=Marinobacter sp. VGCF2001 TaxID=3417189 RepID=UPI003CF89B68
MISDNYILRPSWTAPESVQALGTTRKGGVSQAPWASLNLGTHVGDEAGSVAENRQRLARFTGLDVGQIGWLNQVHGTRVVELTPETVKGVPEADASFTRVPGLACAILTADCLPVVLADARGTVVGAAHAGWRSLAGGVLEKLVTAMGVEPGTLSAWLGPAIGPDSFEVGPEVRDCFVQHSPQAARAFKTDGARPGHFMADLYRLATQRLERAGVNSVAGGSICTVQDKEWFFSYRRDGQTGRMVTLIWIKA